MTLSRRLAAILAADIAGYSRLMGADEEGTHERLRAHLRELVHPAIEDGFGLVVSQALASGRPVIVSRMAGASELVRDGENGFLVDSGSVSQLKDRLRWLAADEALCQHLQASARASVSAYGVPAFVNRVLSFYATCLDHAA